jgi:bifunctional DNase/RNase
MEPDIEVKVGALIMEPHSGTPIVVLRGVSDETVIPIWVGTFEANAIALEIEKTVPQRPMTHDLLRNIITQFGAVVERVIITELRSDTFFALIEMRQADGQLIVIDARPSDAIALALRFSCGIWVKPDVVRLAGTNINSAADNEDQIEEESLTEDWPDVIGES